MSANQFNGFLPVVPGYQGPYQVTFPTPFQAVPAVLSAQYLLNGPSGELNAATIDLSTITPLGFTVWLSGIPTINAQGAQIGWLASGALNPVPAASGCGPCGVPPVQTAIVAGPIGATGPSGPAGATVVGATGPSGASGAQGVPGPIGSQGASGAGGATGSSGPPFAFFTGALWSNIATPSSDIQNPVYGQSLNFGTIPFASGSYIFVLTARVSNFSPANGGMIANNGLLTLLNGQTTIQQIPTAFAANLGSNLLAFDTAITRIFQATVTQGNVLYLNANGVCNLLEGTLAVFALPASIINSPGFI